MKRFSLGRHRKLLFRSYLFLAAGLLVVAAVLDLGFGYLQSNEDDSTDRWLTASFQLIEGRLAQTPPPERNRVLSELRAETGLAIQLLGDDEVASASEPHGNIETLVNDAGDVSYLRRVPALGGHLRVGPVEETQDGAILDMLPPLFYLSILIIVGLWLRPLLRDLNLMTSASQRFAADYREPLKTADSTTQLTSLASNLDEMSARLSGLIQTQKELIAALSHEMRTPLARIRMALAVVSDKGSEETKQQLDDVVDDVQEIDQLIGTMLSYARLDHPDLRMNWQQVPVGPWLEQVRKKCTQPHKDLDIKLDESLDTAWMDPRLMELALSNLLVNAGKYASRQVRCRVGPEKRGYRIVVEDDGAGIPEAKREAIFKAFSRLDDSRNRDTGGYGLGLAIVSRIAALHGGTISVDTSDELGGARFSLEWLEPD